VSSPLELLEGTASAFDFVSKATPPAELDVIYECGGGGCRRGVWNDKPPGVNFSVARPKPLLENLRLHTVGLKKHGD
jgi:hypothetical protein